MRGPIVFLLAAAAATVGTVLFVAPALEERKSLVRRIENLADLTGRQDPSGPEAAARLLRAIGREGDPLLGIRGVVLEYAPLDRITLGEDRIAFPADWRKMPELLARVAVLPGVVLGEVRIEPEEPAAKGRITLILIDPERGIGAE